MRRRMYWAALAQPTAGFDRYGYVGLVIGYFLYYYLYAGNWGLLFFRGLDPPE